MMRRLPILLMLFSVGCGPSAQEQYDMAMNRLERERTQLALLRPAYDAAIQRATASVVQESAGVALDEMLAGLQQQVGGLDAKPAADGQDPFQMAEDLAARQQTAQEGLAKVGDALVAARQPDPAQNERIQELLQADSDYQAYLKQQARVERALKAVEEAEAALEQ